MGSSKGGKAMSSFAHAAEGRDFVMHARMAAIRALQRNDVPPPLLEFRKFLSGQAQAEERPMKTVWDYPDTSQRSRRCTFPSAGFFAKQKL
jgi:hypothetical protein